MSFLRTVKTSVMERSRKKKLEHFCSFFKQGMTVLDAGVSSEAKEGPRPRNYFLKHFKYPAEHYTGLGGYASPI